MVRLVVVAVIEIIFCLPPPIIRVYLSGSVTPCMRLTARSPGMVSSGKRGKGLDDGIFRYRGDFLFQQFCVVKSHYRPACPRNRIPVVYRERGIGGGSGRVESDGRLVGDDRGGSGFRFFNWF